MRGLIMRLAFFQSSMLGLGVPPVLAPSRGVVVKVYG